MTTINYQQQANDFLSLTGTELKVEFLEFGKHFANDLEDRDIYKITLKKGQIKYSFNFGQSIAHSGEYIVKDVNPRFTKIFGNKSDAIQYAYKIGAKFNATKNPSKQIPTAYDVLTCLTKYPVYDFADFCAEYGYDNDSRQAYKTYKAVKREWENVAILFNDEQLEILREIN